MFLIFLMNACVALIFTFDKEILHYLTPMTFLSLRSLFCGIILGSAYLLLNRKNLTLNRELLNKILISCLISFFNIYLANLFFFESLKTLSSAKAALLYNTKPFIVALLAYFLLKDSLSFKKILGLVIGWLGFIPILFFTETVDDTLWSMSRGEVYALATAFVVSCSYIIYNKLHKNQKTKERSSILLIGAIKLIFSGLLAYITMYFTELQPTLFTPEIINPYSLCIFSIIITGTIGWVILFTYLTSVHSASFLAATGFTIPLFTAFFEWIFFGRSVSSSFYLTTIIIAVGLFIVYRAEQHKLPKKKLYRDVEID